MSLQRELFQMTENIINEFSRLFNLGLIKKNRKHVSLEATKMECQLLARRFSIPGIISIKAECYLSRLTNKEKGDFLLEADLSAKINQNCVLTLEEIEENIRENFKIIFKDNTKEDIIDDMHQVEFELDEDDIVYVEDMEVDLGEYIAEYLSLSINPYPKKDNVDASELGYKILKEDDLVSDSEKVNPFSVLKDLKHKT